MVVGFIIQDGIIKRKKEIWLFNHHFKYDLIGNNNQFRIGDHRVRRVGTYSESGDDIENLDRDLEYYKGFLKDLKEDETKREDPDFLTAMRSCAPPRILVFGSHIYGDYQNISGDSYSLDTVRFAHQRLFLDIPITVTEESKEYWQEFGSLWIPKDALIGYLEKLVSEH